MMRIAQLVSLQESVPPKGKNGLEHMVHYLTEELVRRGHEVTLFATSDSHTRARLVEVLPYPMAKEALFDMTPTHYALTVMAKAAEMSDQFDLIHSHLGPIAYYFSRLARCPILETVHSAHGLLARGEEEAELREYYRDRRERRENVHHVFVSRNQQEKCGLSRNASVIYNGISFEDFTFRGEGGEYFAYLGYLTPEKGAHLAVQAARRAGVKLRLAGSYYGCEQYFQSEIAPFLEEGKVEYMGVLAPAERNRFLGSARALLFPVNWEEPFGLVMIEAMACGTPVIGFKRAAAPEVIVPDLSGFLVETPEEMAEALGRVDALDRRECRAYVEANFSVERMTDGYERAYARLLGLPSNGKQI
jgi:glycosyltransferase involved in cell wall biosynthesis